MNLNDPFLNQIFGRLSQIAEERNQRQEETNMQVFERTGVMLLTETMSNEYTWMPNVRFAPEATKTN